MFENKACSKRNLFAGNETLKSINMNASNNTKNVSFARSRSSPFTCPTAFLLPEALRVSRQVRR
jgi:hypothetical protein